MKQDAVPAPVIVVGSVNQDYSIAVPRPVAPGETILATGMTLHAGGKGGNQAVAAARMGVDVSLIACVGDDPDGEALLGALRAEGVDTSSVEYSHETRTGLAIVEVAESGENSIVVVPGANFSLSARRVGVATRALAAPGGILVLQAEIKIDVIRSAIRAGERFGLRTVFNLAPYQDVPDDLLAVSDPLVVNESEASALIGYAVHSLDDAEKAVTELVTRCRSVIITLGGQGAVWSDRTRSGHIPAEKAVEVVDTTGAGDAFIGALAASLARSASLEEAVTIGIKAGTFAVGRPGAQASYPTPDDIGLLVVPLHTPTRTGVEDMLGIG
jgi:ribokinase